MFVLELPRFFGHFTASTSCDRGLFLQVPPLFELVPGPTSAAQPALEQSSVSRIRSTRVTPFPLTAFAGVGFFEPYHVIQGVEAHRIPSRSEVDHLSRLRQGGDNAVHVGYRTHAKPFEEIVIVQAGAECNPVQGKKLLNSLKTSSMLHLAP